jgi:hypothetical protein
MQSPIFKYESKEDRRTRRRWTISIWSGCALLTLVLFGFLGTHPSAVKSISDVAQAEFVGPAAPDQIAPTQLAARKITGQEPRITFVNVP